MSHRSPLTILLIDDCAKDRVELCHFLQQNSLYNCRIVEFDTARQALKWCQQAIPDVIVLDLLLPNGDGLKFIQEFWECRSYTQTAVIMLTGQGDEMIPFPAMKSGIQNYLVKDKLTAEVLQGAIHHAVERINLTRQLEQSREQQQLIAAIALRIRQSLKLEEILHTTSTEVRQFLKADRVLVYQFQPDMSGTIVAESVLPGWTVALGKQIMDTCFQQGAGNDYRQGKKRVIDDIYQAGLTNCHLHLLEQFEVKANLVVPILVKDQLWGLLIAHQCRASRHWQSVELDLLDQLAVQIAIAIQQGSVHQQAQAELVERQRTEAALKASEEKLKLTLNFAGIGYWEWNPITNQLFLSENAIHCFHFESGDANLTYEQWLNQIHPEDQERVEQEFRQAIARQTDYDMEYRVVWQNGSIHWVSVKGRGVYDPTGQLLQMLGVLIDITERKLSEEEHRRAQMLQMELQLLEDILETAQAGYWDWNIPDNQGYFSPTLKRMFGYEADELANPSDSWLHLIFPEDLPEILESFRQHFKTCSQIPYYNEIKYRHKDGSAVWAISSGRVIEWDTAGNPRRIIGCNIDITKRKELETQFCKNAVHLATAQRIAHLGSWEFDLQTQELIWSEEVFRIFGRDPASGTPTYQEFCESIHPNDRHAHDVLVQQTIEQRKFYEEEYRSYRPDGSLIYLLSRGEVICDADGQPTQLVGTLLDVTNVYDELRLRKQVEAALRDSERRYATLTKAAPVAIFRLDAFGNCIYINDRWSEMTGRATEAALGMGWIQALHPEDRDRILRGCLKFEPRHLDPRKFYQSEGRHLRPDGSINWFCIQVLPETNPFGNIIGYISTLTDISDRKQAEEQLHHLSERLTLALQSGRFGIWEYDFAQGKQIWDAQMHELYGFRNGDFVGTYEAWLNCLHPDDRDYMLATIEQVLQGKQEYSVEFRIIQPSGKIRFLKGYGILKRDQQGEPVRIIGVNFDISDVYDELRLRKQAQEALAKYAYEVEDLYNNAPCGYHSLDGEGRLIKVNETELQWLGYTREEMIGQPLVNFFTQASRLSFTQNYPSFKQQGWVKDLEYDMICKDGTVLPVLINATAVKDADGNYLYNRATLFDIRERKQTAQALEESRKMLQTVLDTFPQRVFWKDRQSRFLGCNPAFIRHSQLTAHEIIGKTDFELPWSKLAHLYRADDVVVMNTRTPKLGYEEPLEGPNGEQLWLRTNKVPLTSSTGEVIGVLVSHEDITERKQAEAQLRQTNEQLANANVELARATRLKDEFLANMSHELRTPLNAILGMSEGLQESVFGSINERQAKAIATIERSGRHLLELINDILDLSKIESGKLELQLSDVSVSSLCDASLAFVKQMALKKNIRLNTHISKNIYSIQVDNRRLRQILINLLSNAVKFTPQGGSVTLEVRLEGLEGEGGRGAGGANSSSNLCFHVTDTGIGIAPEEIGKLFQPFIQLDSSLNRQYSGTGLGLALVQKIVTLHEGTVSVRSEVGKGSCFTVCIPYRPSDNMPTTQVTTLLPSYRLPAENAQVLIIEDSIAAADQIIRYLREMGMQPLVYSNGEGALEEVLRVQPALIILDVQLPNLSGWDVLNQLKTNPKTKDIPAIIISVVDDHSKGLAQGAFEYLVKPITRTQLQITIEKLQYSARSESPNLIVLPKADLKSPLILLVEDNQANIDTMSGYLESRGYHLILANNGQQAIELVTDQRPDLIVMDIQMPGMDGLEAMRRIRDDQKFVDIPMIALTALAMPGDRETCLAAGANEYLTKPIKLKQLVATIQQLLEK